MFIAVHFFIIFTILLLLLLYFFVGRNFNHWKERNVPFLKPMPFFGNVYKVFMLKISIGEFLAQLYNLTNEQFFGFFIFDKPFLLIRSPEIIKHILIKDFEYFDDRSIIDNRRDDVIGSNILFLLKNPKWRPVRVKFSSVFATGKMRNMLPLMLESSKDLKSYLTETAVKESSTETRELAMKFTTDIISSCAFGIDAHCFQNEDAEFRQVSKRIFDWNLSRKVQMASYFFAPVLVRLLKMKFLEPGAAKFLEGIFKYTVAEREKTKAYRGDLIDVLIQLRNENMDVFDEKMLVAQSVQFFIAGFETTGSTISFTLYELALNPVIQDHLRNEIRTILEKHQEVTYEAIQEMDYLDMTIKETLRKYPVVPFLDRRCKMPYKIPNTDVVVDKGLAVYIPLLGLHFDPQYFPKPLVYDPERFTSENKASRPAYCYLPFGDGPHNCIGARFGILGTKVALIHILSDLQVQVTENTEDCLGLDPKGFLMAPRNGIPLKFSHCP